MAKFLLFLIGLFSQTQINLGGKIGISEFVMTLAAPFIFLRDYQIFRREKVLPYFLLIILWLIGAIIADVANQTPLFIALKGWAFPMTVFGSSVCVYILLRKDLLSFKWFVGGVTLSFFLSIFVFQRGRAGDMATAAMAIERVVSYKLFWAALWGTVISFPIVLWYQKIPRVLSLLGVLFIAGYNMYIGGRSGSACWLCTAILILIGRHGGAVSPKKMTRYFLMAIVFMGVAGFGLKTAYKKLALGGVLGENEARKYEQQTSKGSGFIPMLVSGRVATFVGLYAAWDSPILGHGTHPLDTNGYWNEFVLRYGDDTDRAQYESYVANNAGMVTVIPDHSHIIAFWLWHGMFGLIFWVYVIILVFTTLRKRIYAVPWLVGYFAISIPAFLWNVFFSPFGMRVDESALFIMCFLVRNMTQNNYHIECIREKL